MIASHALRKAPQAHPTRGSVSQTAPDILPAQSHAAVSHTLVVHYTPVHEVADAFVGILDYTTRNKKIDNVANEAIVFIHDFESGRNSTREFSHLFTRVIVPPEKASLASASSR